MQTFVPYRRPSQSARALDVKRLGKQRVECKQIVIALTEGRGWIHHPATKMWTGYVPALCWYAKAMCAEFARRGHNDNLYEFFDGFAAGEVVIAPPWLGDADVAASHRSNLVHKEPDWYTFKVPALRVPYLWPVVADGEYKLFLSRAEAARDDWNLPKHLAYNPTTREVTR